MLKLATRSRRPSPFKSSIAGEPAPKPGAPFAPTSQPVGASPVDEEPEARAAIPGGENHVQEPIAIEIGRGRPAAAWLIRAERRSAFNRSYAPKKPSFSVVSRRLRPCSPPRFGQAVVAQVPGRRLVRVQRWKRRFPIRRTLLLRECPRTLRSDSHPRPRAPRRCR